MASATLEDHSYSTFTFAPMASNRYATPLKSPLAISTPFASPFQEASTLLDANVTYTTYSLNPQATATEDGPYGQSAYAAMWASASLSYSERPLFTTTATPTAIKRNELVFPTALPVIPMDQNKTSNGLLPSDFVWGVASSAWQIEGGL